MMNGSHSIASSATLSRARLLVDVAYMLFMRDEFAKMFQPTTPKPTLFALIDSSPQGGRNWELTEIHDIRGEALSECGDAAREMLSMCESVSKDSPEACDRHEELKQTIAGSIFYHVAPPSALGTRQSSLEQKLHAVMHSLRLETHSWNSADKLLKSFTCICADMGTEAQLSEVDDISIPIKEGFNT